MAEALALLSHTAEALALLSHCHCGSGTSCHIAEALSQPKLVPTVIACAAYGRQRMSLRMAE